MSILYDVFLLLVKLIISLLGLYTYVIIFTALISWVNPDPYNPIVRFLYKATEPVLYPIRRFIGNRLGPIDISPIVVIIIIMFIQSLLTRIFLMH